MSLRAKPRADKSESLENKELVAFCCVSCPRCLPLAPVAVDTSRKSLGRAASQQGLILYIALYKQQYAVQGADVRPAAKVESTERLGSLQQTLACDFRGSRTFPRYLTNAHRQRAVVEACRRSP